MAEPFTLYKLIVLYILNKVDFPLTNSQISEFILDKGYTNYFKIQQDIEQYLSEKQYELKNEVSVKADYYRNTNMEYSVRCQVIESGLPLIDLTITVPTEAEAEKIAVNWEKKNQEIYAYIMAHLL